MNAISPQLLDSLAWTLIHFLWQGLIIGLLAAVALRALRNAKPQARYLTALIAFAGCIIAPAITFIVLWQSASAEAAALTNLEGALISSIDLIRDRHYPQWLLNILPDLPPLLVAAWLAGVVVGVLRLFAGYLGVQWVRRSGLEPVPARLQRLFDELADEFQVSGRAVLRLSHRILTPMTVGWIRPVVLVPASAWMGLPREELSMILAHELAHIRRCDYLVNLVQQAAVTLLFYHPVVHWLSRVLSDEREMCCDEMVVGESEASRLTYAKALLHLQEQHAELLTLAMSARGGAFLRRVYRLLTTQEEQQAPRTSVHGLVGLLMIGVVNLVFMLHANDAVANFKDVYGKTDTAPAVAVLNRHPLDLLLDDVHSSLNDYQSRRQAQAQEPSGRRPLAYRGAGQVKAKNSGTRANSNQADSNQDKANIKITSLNTSMLASMTNSVRSLAREELAAAMAENEAQPIAYADVAAVDVALDLPAVRLSPEFELAEVSVARRSEVKFRPRLINKVMPRYPMAAQVHGARGEVRLIYVLNRDGSIGEIQHDPDSVDHPALVHAAVAALEKWEYEPFEHDRSLVMAQTFRFINVNGKKAENCFSRLKDVCSQYKRSMHVIQINTDNDMG